MGGNSAPSVEFGSDTVVMGIVSGQDTIPQALTRLGRGEKINLSSSVFQVSFKEISRSPQESFKPPSNAFQGDFKGVESVFPALNERVQENFEPYRATNQSRLEPWREQIVQMRGLNWPYLKISQWLARNTEVSVSFQAVHQFCKVRGIQKGTLPKPPPPKAQVSTRVPGKRKRSSKKRFEYDEADQPIDLSNLKTKK